MMATSIPMLARGMKRARIDDHPSSEYLQYSPSSWQESVARAQQMNDPAIHANRELTIPSQCDDTMMHHSPVSSVTTLESSPETPSSRLLSSIATSTSSSTVTTPTHQMTSRNPSSASSTSSTHNSLDEPLPIHPITVEEDPDSDTEQSTLPSNATRKMKHRQTEQRRRDRLNAGITNLQILIGSKKQDKASVVNAAKLFIQQQAEIATRLHTQCKQLTQQLEQQQSDDSQSELEKLRAEKAQLQRQVDLLLSQQGQSQQMMQQAGMLALTNESIDYRSTFMSNGISRVMFDVLGRFIDSNDEFLADTGFSRFELSKPFMTCMSITPAYEHPYALETTRLLQINEKRDMMVMKSFYTTTGKIVCRQTIVAPLRNSHGAITGFILNGLPTRAEDLPRLIRVCGQQFYHMGCKPPLPHGASVIPSIAGTPRSLPSSGIVTVEEQQRLRAASKAGMIPHPYAPIPKDYLGNQSMNEMYGRQLRDMRGMAQFFNQVVPTDDILETSTGNSAYMAIKDFTPKLEPNTNPSPLTSPIPSSPSMDELLNAAPTLPPNVQLYKQMSTSPPADREAGFTPHAPTVSDYSNFLPVATPSLGFHQPHDLFQDPALTPTINAWDHADQ